MTRKKSSHTASLVRSSAAECLTSHAESEFEKYRVVQDRLFEGDFDRVVAETKRLAERDANASSPKARKP